MNARQKAKKLKKELEYIKSRPFTDIPTEHLRAFRIFPLEEIERCGEEVIEDEAIYLLSNEFLKYIRENMIVKKGRDLDRLHAMKYSADIWIGLKERSDSE